MLDFRLTGNRPVYEQIAEQVRQAVAGGKLRPGDRLEPVRDLAERLAVNPGTVARAYQLLEQQGIIETNRRRGSLIAVGNDDAALRSLRAGRLRALAERTLVEALAQGYTPAEVEAAFSTQLAAWRERRSPVTGRGGPLVTAPDRLHRFAGSHDLALEALWAHTRNLSPANAIEPRYVGSLDGLLALLHGEAALAGTHLLDEETGEYNVPILSRLFIGHPLCVVTLAERQQGLIVPPANPLGLQSFADLARPGVRMVNRQPGSGTRALLDYHLQRAGVTPQALAGYEDVVYTHLGVAEAVAARHADAGVGLAAAASAFELAFVPLARERYDLVLFTEDRERQPLADLLAILKDPAYRAVIDAMGGYDTTHTGQEVRLS